MTKLQQSLTEKLYPMIENEKPIYKQMVEYLFSLGYLPQKLNNKGFSLYFVHSGKKIARIRIYDSNIEFAFKFYACKSVPAWCINSLLAECDMPFEDAGKWYDLSMKKCDNDCTTCGSVKYNYISKDGREIYKCTSNLICFSNIDVIDFDDFKKIVAEQHEFFMSLPPCK